MAELQLLLMPKYNLRGSPIIVRDLKTNVITIQYVKKRITQPAILRKRRKERFEYPPSRTLFNFFKKMATKEEVQALYDEMDQLKFIVEQIQQERYNETMMMVTNMQLLIDEVKTLRERVEYLSKNTTPPLMEQWHIDTEDLVPPFTPTTQDLFEQLEESITIKD